MRNVSGCMLLLLFLCSFLVYAEVYKWVDEHGNVHYSQSRPADKSAEVLKKSGVTIDTESALQEIEQQREKFHKLDEERAKVVEEQSRLAERQALEEENCRVSRSRLQGLQRSGRIRTVDEQGEISRATEEEHQARIREARQHVSEWCD